MGEESVLMPVMVEQAELTEDDIENIKRHKQRQFKGIEQKDYDCRKQKEWFVNDPAMPVELDKGKMKLIKILRKMRNN